MTKTLKIDSEIVNELQRLSVEVDSRKSLIAFMINNDMDTTSDRYLQYEDEYKKYYLEYDLLKNKFEKEIIFPAFPGAKVIRWNLDFNTEIVDVEIAD